MCSNGGVQNGPATESPRLNHRNRRNRWKILKNLLLQNHLPQMFEIRFVAMPGGLCPIMSGIDYFCVVK